MGWIRRIFNKSREEKSLDRELRFHIERQTADYVAAGMAPDEARRRAQMEFGGLDLVKEEVRDTRRERLLENLFQDLRYGLRMLRKNPGFTAAAVVTLALGIGANTAIFSIVNAALLRPLPYKDSSRIVDISTKTDTYPRFTLGNSWPAFQRIRSQASALEESAVYMQAEKTLTGQGNPARLNVTNVSDGFFEELGGTAQRGRLLGEADQKAGQNFVAVISDGLWRTRYGSDPSAVGKTLILDKQVYTVVGVAPRGFAFPDKNDVWVPLSLTPQIERDATFFALQVLGKPSSN